MFCAERLLRCAAAAMLALGLSACVDSVENDLVPSDEDRRPIVEPGSTGSQPGQIAPDFSLMNTVGEEFRLADHLRGGAQPADAVVLYFTMWCPVCLSHTDHLHNEIVPRFAGRGDIVYALVDYVSGSVDNARASELANGYAGSAFAVLVDAQLQVFDAYRGAMGKVVIIDTDGNVLLSEDYRNGENLAAALESLLP